MTYVPPIPLPGNKPDVSPAAPPAPAQSGPRHLPFWALAVIAALVVLVLVTVALLLAYMPTSTSHDVTLYDDYPPLQLVTSGPNYSRADWIWVGVPNFPVTVPEGGFYNLTFLLGNMASINFTIDSFTVNLPYTFQAGLSGVVANGTYDHVALNLTMPSVAGDYQLGLIIRAS